MSNKSKWLYLSSLLLIVGAINWGMVGFFNYDVVAHAFGAVPLAVKATYALIALAAVPAVVELTREL